MGNCSVCAQKASGGSASWPTIPVAEAWAVAQGLGKVRVRCNVVRERTHRFYEREGFVVTKTQKIFDKG